MKINVLHASMSFPMQNILRELRGLGRNYAENSKDKWRQMKHPHLALAPCKWPQLWFQCSDCSCQLWFTGQVPEALLGAPLVTISPVGFLGAEDVCTEGMTEPCTESTQDILKMWHQPGRTASDFSGCSHFPFSCHLTNAGAHKKAAAETSNPIFQNVRVRISPASSSLTRFAINTCIRSAGISIFVWWLVLSEGLILMDVTRQSQRIEIKIVLVIIPPRYVQI